MKSKKNLLEQLKTLPHFNKNAVYQLGKQLGLKDSTVDTYISRFLKYNEIFQLKNGLYVTSAFYDKYKHDGSYSFYLANIIRVPSYISSWAALQYYGLATESINSITSVTIKVTKDYQAKAGNFAYQSIKKELFSDFHLVTGRPGSDAGGFDFFIASPAKALFDLLYFRTRQFRGIKLEDIDPMIEELRIDFDEMDIEEQEKFYSFVKNILI
ncbi:MAG: hypothetical protein WCT26_00150 [Candidatus Buchananbacteria bacterium]|jgi:predicted transcriptional regulator of viral defense system